MNYFIQNFEPARSSVEKQGRYRYDAQDDKSDSLLHDMNVIDASAKISGNELSYDLVNINMYVINALKNLLFISVKSINSIFNKIRTYQSWGASL